MSSIANSFSRFITGEAVNNFIQSRINNVFESIVNKAESTINKILEGIVSKGVTAAGLVGVGVLTQHYILQPMSVAININYMLVSYALLEMSGLPMPVVRGLQLMGSGIILQHLITTRERPFLHVISAMLMLAAPVAAQNMAISYFGFRITGILVVQGAIALIRSTP